MAPSVLEQDVQTSNAIAVIGNTDKKSVGSSYVSLTFLKRLLVSVGVKGQI